MNDAVSVCLCSSHSVVTITLSLPLSSILMPYIHLYSGDREEMCCLKRKELWYLMYVSSALLPDFLPSSLIFL